MNSSRNTVSGLHIPYWATRKTWPRGRSCQDKSGLAKYWMRDFWWDAEDNELLREELEQEAAYRRWHEQRMVQELCAHSKVTPYPEGGWTCNTCGLWQWVSSDLFSINLADIKPYIP